MKTSSYILICCDENVEYIFGKFTTRHDTFCRTFWPFVVAVSPRVETYEGDGGGVCVKT